MLYGIFAAGLLIGYQTRVYLSAVGVAAGHLSTAVIQLDVFNTSTDITQAYKDTESTARKLWVVLGLKNPNDMQLMSMSVQSERVSQDKEITAYTLHRYYQLIIRDTQKFASSLEKLKGFDNVQINWISYQFPDLEQMTLTAIEDGMKKIRNKAKNISDMLGIALYPHSFSLEPYYDLSYYYDTYTYPRPNRLSVAIYATYCFEPIAPGDSLAVVSTKGLCEPGSDFSYVVAYLETNITRPSSVQAQIELNRTTRAFAKKIEGEGEVSVINSYIESEHNDQGHLIGYTAYQSFTMRLDKASSVPALLSQVASTKDISLKSLDYVNEISEGEMKQASKQAFENALEQASLVASLAGLKTGRVVEFWEDSVNPAVDINGAGSAILEENLQGPAWPTINQVSVDISCELIRP